MLAMGRSPLQWVSVAGLVVLVVGLSWPVFSNGFVYDDVDVILDGDVIHDPGEIWTFFQKPTMYASPAQRDMDLLVNTYRPITLISFVWDSALSGTAPWAYHATNLIMHVLCTILVFLFVRELIGRPRWPFALLAATWFSLSPHPATAHIWINGRSDLFCTFFGLAAILVWRRAVAGPRRVHLHVAAMTFFFAGLLSKEVLIMALPVLLVWPEKSPVSLRTRVGRVSGLGVMAALYLVVRVRVLGGMRTHESPEHVLTALSYLAPLELDGLLGALAPVRLYLRFMNETLSAFGVGELFALWLVAGALVVVTLSVRRRLPLVSWGLLWFAACLAPVVIISGMVWPGFGRYLYLPSAGLAVALATLAGRVYDGLPQLRMGLVAAGVLYLAVLAVSLRGWIADFRNEETLYQAAIVHNPEGPHAYGWLAFAYRRQGELDKAADAFAQAHRLAPDHERYLRFLVDCFAQTGRTEAAVRAATEGASRYESQATPFHMFLFQHYHASEPATAAEQLLQCLRKDPTSAVCGKALTDVVTRHPLRASYRQAVSEVLREPNMRAVRAQVAPLMGSLPAATTKEAP